MKGFIVVPTALVLFSLPYAIAGNSTTIATAQSGSHAKITKPDSPLNSSVYEMEFQTEQEILAKLKGIINEKFGIKPGSIQLKSRLVEDLRVDPLAVVEICMAIDKKFNISTSAKDCESLKTIQDIVEVVKKNLKVKR